LLRNDSIFESRVSRHNYIKELAKMKMALSVMRNALLKEKGVLNQFIWSKQRKSVVSIKSRALLLIQGSWIIF
jgi:hypothetical protein